MVNNGKTIKLVAIVLTATGFIVTSAISMETRYAKATDVRDLRIEVRTQMNELKLIVLEARLYELRFRAEQRVLTELERRRLLELEAEVAYIRQRLNQ